MMDFYRGLLPRDFLISFYNATLQMEINNFKLRHFDAFLHNRRRTELHFEPNSDVEEVAGGFPFDEVRGLTWLFI
jgi:hypothetical protein